MKNHNAIRCIDEYQCSKCGKAWDINDPDIPDCVDVEPKMTWYIQPNIVEYFGLNIQVPVTFYYLATDKDGFVYAYENCPVVGLNRFINNSVIDKLYIGRVDLNGINWKETLREI